MDQASDVPSIIFFHDFFQNSLQKSYQFIYLFFIYQIAKIKIKSFEYPKSIKSIRKSNTLNIRLLVDDSFVPSSKQSSVIYCRLTDFKNGWHFSFEWKFLTQQWLSRDPFLKWTPENSTWPNWQIIGCGVSNTVRAPLQPALDLKLLSSYSIASQKHLMTFYDDTIQMVQDESCSKNLQAAVFCNNVCNINCFWV